MHSHGNGHHHHHHGTGAILRWSLVATTLFVVVELVAGFQAHSLALLSDAGHNFTDALALALAWAGFYLQSKPADESKTYGYHRAGVLSAFVNALTLVALSVWILYEAVLRLRAPEPVHEDHHDGGGGTRAGAERRASCWRCAPPAATTSTSAARSFTCWATRWARWRSSPAPS